MPNLNSTNSYMVTQEILHDYASVVREAIFKNKEFNSWKERSMGVFPFERCDEASYILMEYLKRKKIVWFSRVHAEGVYEHRHISHVWLEDNQFVLDITADQFDWRWDGKRFDPVIVIQKDKYFFKLLESQLSWIVGGGYIRFEYQNPGEFNSYASMSPAGEGNTFDINEFKEFIFSSVLSV